MPNRSAKPQGRPRRENAGYEKRDANAKWIFGIVAFLIISGLIMHFALAGVMARLEKRRFPPDAWQGARRSPGATVPASSVPHLQIMPAVDFAEFRSRDETQLNTYGWVNRTSGVVRIPIARAMELLLERGLPTRSGTNAAATGPTVFEVQQQRPQSSQPQNKEAR
jgi:hypothetical protein